MTAPLKSTPERLLFELCRSASPRGDVTPLRVEGGLASLRALEGLAIRHGVQGLVYSRLVERLPEDDRSRELRDAAEDGLSRLRRQTSFRDMEQDRVLRGLAGAGLHPLVLKGGALRRTVFTPLERTMGDLDLLVEPDEVESVLEALQALGYRSEYPEAARPLFREHHHEEEVAHPMGFLAEVHWGLTRPGDLIRLDPDGFRARSVTVETPGSPAVRIPCPEDMLVHTVSQIEQEAVRGLRRLVDLDRIARTPDLDWDQVRRQTAGAGLGGFLCVSMRLANLLLGTEAPVDILDGSILSRRARRAVASLRPVRRLLEEPRDGEAIEFHLFRLWCMDPVHRRSWLRRAASGYSDPLHWVWEKQNAPGEAGPVGTTGLTFLLKLAGYQSILVGTTLWKHLTDSAGPWASFWLDSGAAAPETRPRSTPA
jgi:hypothetical protein